MKFIDTNIKNCEECQGTYKIRLLKIGTSEIALCKNCRDKLYKIVDEEDTITVYTNNNLNKK